MNCDYLTYVGPKLMACGKPATHQGVKPPKRCYCADHAKQVSRPGGISILPLKAGPTSK